VPYPTIGASNRLRVEQYAPLLREMGIDLRVSSFLDDPTYQILYEPGHVAAKSLGVARGIARRIRDTVRARRSDLVLVHRESAPVGPALFERALSALNVGYVFDFDDATFLPAYHPANRRWAWMRPLSRIDEVARRATAVIAGNEYLASWARERNTDVTIIPTPVDTVRHMLRSPHALTSPVVIGWVGSSTTAPYLRIVDRALGRLMARRDVIIRIVGGQYRNDRARVEVAPYDLEREPRELERFDIGILPEPDDPWTRGKGAFKALLYMATGVPVVASRVGVNPDVIEHGVTGFCVDGDDEWVDALDRLAGDPQLRQRMGLAGRRRVEERYSLTVLAPRLAGVLRRAARREGGAP
jgi:glycosyltransferase involved in cell wall biosynthesis